MRLILVPLLLLCLSSVLSKRDPPRTPSASVSASHEEMKQWIDKHPFQFAFPKAFDRFFIERLVVNTDGFVLPPGMLWPYPQWVWNFKTSWLFDNLFGVRF